MILFCILSVIAIITLILIAKFQPVEDRDEGSLFFVGLKTSLPQWLHFAKKNKFKLIKNGRNSMEFQNTFGMGDLTSRFYIEVRSYDTNYARAWIIKPDNNVVKSCNVDFAKSPTQSDIEKVFSILMQDLIQKEAFNICKSTHVWKYHSDYQRSCVNCLTSENKSFKTGKWGFSLYS